MSYLCYLFVYICPTHIFLTKCDFFLFFFFFFCIVLSNEKIIMWINYILWFLLIILLIVGILIDNNAFVCLLFHRHSNSGLPFFLIWSLPRLWYGSLSGSISLKHLSIFFNISCYNSLVLLIFVSRSSCRITLGVLNKNKSGK
jgi:hypothetical protein